MPTYQISAPDGKTYSVDGPAGASDEQVRNEVIRQNPHLGGAPSGASQIPGGNAAPSAPAPELTPLQKYVGVPIDTLTGLASGAIGGLASSAARIGHEITQGHFGTPEGRAAAEQFGHKVSDQFYQPRTEQAQNAIQGVADVAIPASGLHFGMPAGAMRPAMGAVGDVAKSAVTTAPEVVAARAQANLANSVANGNRIDAASNARDIGVAVNAYDANPTKSNFVKVNAAGGEAHNVDLSNQNFPMWNKIVGDQLGVKPGEQLNKATFDRLKNEAGAPNQAIAAMPGTFLAAPEQMAKIDALKVEPALGETASSAATNALVDEVKGQLSTGRTPAQMISDVSNLRQNANRVLNAEYSKVGAPSAPAVAEAKVRLKLAAISEEIIDSHINDPKLAGQVAISRAKLARIYDAERATGVVNGNVDPNAFAKMLEDGHPLSGDMAKIGNVAGNYPKNTGGSVVPASIPGTITRSSIPALIGAAPGVAMGNPALATAGVVGATAMAYGTRKLISKSLGSEASQAVNTAARDYRPAPEPVNNLRPAELNTNTANALVPVDNVGNTSMPPNFTMPGNRYGPKVTPYSGPPDNNLLPPPPSNEAIMASVANENARRAAMSRSLGQQADAQQAAAETANRQSATGALNLRVNPLTGKLEVDTGLVKGATPEVFMANTGASLNSAAAKVAAGKTFDMSAAEKVAWDKTSADLSTLMPGMSKLSPEAIAGKMSDRIWVDNAVTKARQQAQAFDDIASRASDARARAAATMKREQLMDLADSLQDSLGPRKVQRGSQGPKTQAANALAQNQQVQNALVK